MGRRQARALQLRRASGGGGRTHGQRPTGTRLSYDVADLRGTDVDPLRNLARNVAVE
jgi:hypothetical protein